jgi:arylsulfate sulfotransferase
MTLSCVVVPGRPVRLAETQLSLMRPVMIRAVALLCFPCALFVAGCANVTLNAALTQPPTSGPPTAGQAGSITITPQYVALAPGQKFQFKATGGGGAQLQWTVNAAGASSAAGTVDASGNYAAPASLSQSENVTVTAALAASPQANYATAVVSIIQPGQVSCPGLTNNPQVVLYTIYLPAPGKVSVQFGLTTSYGLNTWQVPTPSPNGGQVQVYVAGMRATSKYHMQAQVALDDGATYADSDATCTTGIPPITSPVQVSTPGGGVPQPGIEMWNTLLPHNLNQVFASDLEGNVIWTYKYSGTVQDLVQGIQLLPNGHMLMVISYLSSLPSTIQMKTINAVREVDLAGNTIREITMDALNQKLAAANLRDAQGNPYQLDSFHHDVLALPNGHWVLLAAYRKTYAALPGSPPNTAVTGDALVDVDQNLNPDWVWNTFDHLDIDRHPMNFPDWTHSNDMLYSSDDHNLLLSVRHQNWIIKIEFLDGQGSGKVMWRLGEGGDFKLVGGTDPTDWFYAQHGMSYFTPNTTGVFKLGLMDNGNDRLYPSGQVHCVPLGPTTPQCYSTIPVLSIDESAMTAAFVTHVVRPPSYFSFFGGNAELLSNGDIEANFSAPITGAIVQELDPTGTNVLWQATTPNAYQFHASRLPSLYPGVQW